MNAVFGIHIGNTNCTMAVSKSINQAEMIADESGDRIIPSSVVVTDEGIEVGVAAKIGVISNWKTTITNNKFFFSMTTSDVENYNEKTELALTCRDSKIHYCVPLAEKSKFLTPQDVVTILLKKLYNTAKNGLNSNEYTLMCVLLVPEIFSLQDCASYKSAAESAGWKVLQIISETAAPVLSYSLLDHKEPSEIMLVYRLGGTTCEVAAYDLCEGMLYTLGSEFNRTLGGNRFVETLTGYLADEFFKRSKICLREHRRSFEKLKLAAEKCVHILSKAPEAHCFIESLQDGLDFSLVVSRARFELLIQPLQAAFRQPVENLLKRLQLEDPVDKIILCGGGTFVPKFKAWISNLFNLDKTQMLTHINADEALALGAARQGSYLIENNMKEFLPRQSHISYTDPISKVQIDDFEEF